MRKKMSKNILEASLEGVEHIVLLGHIHPDGDCIGTTLGLFNYLRENYPQIEAELFLDHPAAKFSYMNDFEKIHTEIVPEKQFDLCITLDASDKERLGGYAVYLTAPPRHSVSIITEPIQDLQNKITSFRTQVLQRSVIHAS